MRAQGFVDVQVGTAPVTRMYGTGADVPVGFYHGTNPEALLSILLHGQLLTSSELGMPVHRPDGVYAYCGRDVSTESMYVEAGCQVRFRAAVLPLSYNDSKRIGVVPEGAACRMRRAAFVRHGAAAAEWVFHPRSCQLEAARICVASAGGGGEKVDGRIGS